MIIQSSTAQREWEEIAQIHRNPAGLNSARNITGLILDTLAWLETFLLSGHIPMIRNYETVYVYHIAHGASNYPGLFKKLPKAEHPDPTRKRLSNMERRFSFNFLQIDFMRTLL